jgi:hypothetical protein
MSTTRVLSVHAPYRCAHRGVCCTSGWPIPIESAAAHAAERAVASGRLCLQRPARAPFVYVYGAPADTPALVAVVESACVFYRDRGEDRCEIQRVLGTAAMPVTCRQFPRVSVRDPRGTSITLSHYCPTAAALLESAYHDVTILENPERFPPGESYEGLDAHTSLPPRLRPDMLMDWDDWWDWERRSVEALVTAPSAEAGLARLRAAVDFVRDWRPGGGPLRTRIVSAFAQPPVTGSAAAADLARHRREILAAMPDEIRPEPARAAGTPAAPVLQRYLAAHAFANWQAHLGEGLRAWLRSLEAAHALMMSGLDVGTSDLWLRHLADPMRLADAWNAAEQR